MWRASMGCYHEGIWVLLPTNLCIIVWKALQNWLQDFSNFPVLIWENWMYLTTQTQISYECFFEAEEMIDLEELTVPTCDNRLHIFSVWIPSSFRFKDVCILPGTGCSGWQSSWHCWSNHLVHLLDLIAFLIIVSTRQINLVCFVHCCHDVCTPHPVHHVFDVIMHPCKSG